MTTFMAMTWNVENLCRPNLGAEEADVELYERKLGGLARVIGELSPDVVALQEVGGEEPLQDLQEALDGTYVHRAVSAFPDGRGIRVAFLSRLAIQQRTDLADFPAGPALEVRELSAAGEPRLLSRMGRGALRVRVAKEGLTVDLITAHLKSKLLTFPEADSSPRTKRSVPRSPGSPSSAARPRRSPSECEPTNFSKVMLVPLCSYSGTSTMCPRRRRL